MSDLRRIDPIANKTFAQQKQSPPSVEQPNWTGWANWMRRSLGIKDPFKSIIGIIDELQEQSGISSFEAEKILDRCLKITRRSLSYGPTLDELLEREVERLGQAQASRSEKNAGPSEVG